MTTSQPPAQSKMSEQQLNDNLVMETNSSSIVSKRSVERLYFPNEPHFCRFFVRKFQRRSPLVNRGYLLRSNLIHTIVRTFLSAKSTQKKIVVNLGCGSDVLPWQCLTRYPKQCNDAIFVDVDFPDLILRKAAIVAQTDDLACVLTNLEVTAELPCPLRSDKYFQVGCDLCDLATLEAALSSICNPAECRFLFVAEISITYMEPPSADAVIEWASRMGYAAEFCLLEPIMPDGETDPFAKTMLGHFNRLKTPLKSVATYPTGRSQRNRFSTRGWPSVKIWSLWETWVGPDFNNFSANLSLAALDAIEPFDEWEDFALFGSHHILLHATTDMATALVPRPAPRGGPVKSYETIPPAPAIFSQCDRVRGPKGHRRFGAGFVTRDILGREAVVNFLGLGANSRLLTFDVYCQDETRDANLALPVDSPPGRICHTITNLGDFGILLVGGRTSPSMALEDCWLLRKDGSCWERSSNLPAPLYRHSVSRLGKSSLCLLAGGKINAHSVHSEYLVFRPLKGWIRCLVRGQRPSPTFGGILHCCNRAVPGSSTRFGGFLCGGMLEDGTISQQTVWWELVVDDTWVQEPSISFEKCPSLNPEWPSMLINRFGAATILHQDHLVLIGGVTNKGAPPHTQDIVLISVSQGGYRFVSRVQYPGQVAEERPLLIGCSVSKVGGSIIISGGGATCFSMGMFWSKVTLTISLCSDTSTHSSGWKYMNTVELVPRSKLQDANPKAGMGPTSRPQIIQRVQLGKEATFGGLLTAGKPVIIERLDIGTCVSLWSPKNLTSAVGETRKVIVHQSSTETMDFNAKNFTYVTKEFGNFMDQVQVGANMYMRALSKDDPTDKPAILSEDFPEIASDFIIPPELEIVNQKLFSSVLRISGKANMWLHFDVMANVYFQIAGTKHMILFPPSDVPNLSFSPGASSSSLDVFSALDAGGIANTHPQEVFLRPGDVLFLPPLWLHTAKTTSEMSVAVNVFFRDLESGYSTGRDVYGNRDLAAYEKGRQDVARIANSFKYLPVESRAFYVSRLAEELAQKSVM